MSWNDHDHRGQYAEDRHDHDGDYAPLHHRHYDLEREDDRLQGLLREIDGQLGQLRCDLEGALGRIRVLENTNTLLVESLRNLAAGHEEVRLAGMADDYRLAIAEDLAEAFTALAETLAEPEPDEEPPVDEYDPGLEVDDEGGMSEYRHAWPGEDW